MSSGQFWWGMTTGLVAGAVVGMSVAPSRREMKKTPTRWPSMSMRPWRI